MKTIRQAIIGAVVSLFASAIHSLAITNTVIAVSGTNIVLSWPSYGYESYLIQYSQTLSPTDSWSVLTNAYPANSTNLTTFTLYGVVPPPGSGSGGDASGTNPPPPLPDLMSGGWSGSNLSQPMVMPTNGSGSAVPLVLYPPGFSLSGLIIFDPATGEWTNGDGYTVSASTATESADGADPMDESSGYSPSTGFYRVFHIPNWLADVTDYVFDGPTFIPVDYAAPDAPVDHVDDTTVLINGQPTDDAAFIPYVIDGVTNWGVGIYFDRFANGTDTIQLLTTVRQSDTLNDQTPYMVFSNAPETITIGNPVTYTNWADLILSNSYTFNAQSTASNVNWEIDVYDVNGYFVNSQTGFSADGNISWAWDLTDYTGASRLDDSDPFFFPYITITNSSGDPGGWTPPIANQFPSQGDWLFSWLDNFYDDGTTNYAGADHYYTNAVSSLEGGPILYSLGFFPVPLKYGRVYSQTNRDASWVNLKNWLQSWNNRNLYYFGHGAPNSIGGDINTLDSSNNITGSENLPGSQAYLTSGWVHDNVTANRTFGPMPFRFVFLDGCDTAAGGWPAAWGVPNQLEPLSYYQSSANSTGARPSAFVGWDVEIGGSKDWGTVQNFWLFRQYWMANWSVEAPQDENLKQAFDDALAASSWVDAGHYSHMKIFGYESMTFLQYNHEGDWP